MLANKQPENQEFDIPFLLLYYQYLLPACCEQKAGLHFFLEVLKCSQHFNWTPFQNTMSHLLALFEVAESQLLVELPRTGREYNSGQILEPFQDWILRFFENISFSWIIMKSFWKPIGSPVKWTNHSEKYFFMKTWNCLGFFQLHLWNWVLWT